MMAFFILFAAIVSLFVVERWLPRQNLVVLAVIILGVSGGVEVLAAKVGFPFPTLAKYKAGFRVGILPWLVPFWWMLFLVQARQLSRWLLRFWRSHRHYGFWRQGGSAFFTATFWFILETSGGTANFAAYFLARFFISLGLLVLIFPWTLDKRTVVPGREKPSE